MKVTGPTLAWVFLPVVAMAAACGAGPGADTEFVDVDVDVHVDVDVDVDAPDVPPEVFTPHLDKPYPQELARTWATAEGCLPPT